MAASWRVAQSRCWWVSWSRCRVSLAWRREPGAHSCLLEGFSVPLGPPALAVLVSALQGKWSSMANVLTCYCHDVLQKFSKRILSKNRLCMWLLLGNKMIHKNPRSTPQAQLPHRTLSRLLGRSDVLLLSLETRFLTILRCLWFLDSFVFEVFVAKWY